MQSQTWTPAYIGVGSNLEGPRQQVEKGIEALSSVRRTKLVAHSRLYETTPLGPREQPDYVNAAAGLLTQLDAVALLGELKSLEKKLGRAVPVMRWGPRVIDFDLLVYGTERIAEEALTVPHPGIAERAFVLAPLLDIAPQLDVPGLGRIETLAARVDLTGVRSL